MAKRDHECLHGAIAVHLLQGLLLQLLRLQVFQAHGSRGCAWQVRRRARGAQMPCMHTVSTPSVSSAVGDCSAMPLNFSKPSVCAAALKQANLPC